MANQNGPIIISDFDGYLKGNCKGKDGGRCSTSRDMNVCIIPRRYEYSRNDLATQCIGNVCVDLDSSETEGTERMSFSLQRNIRVSLTMSLLLNRSSSDAQIVPSSTRRGRPARFHRGSAPSAAAAAASSRNSFPPRWVPQACAMQRWRARPSRRSIYPRVWPRG